MNSDEGLLVEFGPIRTVTHTDACTIVEIDRPNHRPPPTSHMTFAGYLHCRPGDKLEIRVRVKP